MPLVCNAMLPILAILISAKAFSGYDTIEDLLALEPLEVEMMHLQWIASILEELFFKSMSSRRTRGSIETAVAVGRRLRAHESRAGYANPPTIRDFRAEGLYWISMYTTSPPSVLHLQLCSCSPRPALFPGPENEARGSERCEHLREALHAQQ